MENLSLVINTVKELTFIFEESGPGSFALPMFIALQKLTIESIDDYSIETLGFFLTST